MKSTFEKQEVNVNMFNEEYFSQKITSLGFECDNIQISYTNGASAYISVNVKVLNENKMYADVFVMNGQARLQVRISDHKSNLELICGGVAGNKVSFEAFKQLVENGVIAK